MKLIIDIPDTQYNNIMEVKSMSLGRIPYKGIIMNAIRGIQNGTPIPDNATNGDVIKAMFGADKVFGFIHYVHLMAKVGNWFNEGVVAEFDKDWWNTPYQKGGKDDNN